jgi:hypothetical protein
VSDYWRIVLAVSLGGMLGGLLYWTADYLHAVRPETPPPGPDGAGPKAGEAKPWNFPGNAEYRWNFWFCIANAFTGVGGAWAAALAMLWAKRMPVNKAPLEDQLLLLGTSIIAGYAGNRLLPAVAERLTKELLDRKTEEAKKAAAVAVKVGKSTELDAASAARSELTSEVYTYLDVKGSQSAHQTLEYRDKLKAELKRNPENRKAAVLLARLYAELQNQEASATEVLEEFIRNKTADGQKPDTDVADTSWNLANYYEELFAKTGDPKLRLASIEAVVRAVAIAPGYLRNVKEDPDFESFRNDPEARKRLPALNG